MIFLQSCKNIDKKPDSGLKSFLGSTIVVPQNMEYEFDRLVKNSTNVIVIILGLEDCNECSLKNISIFKHYNSIFSLYNTNIVLITERSNQEEITMLLNKMDINYPIIYDDNYEFINKNKLMTDPILYTFVINAKKEIIWIGSPITDSKTWDLFYKLIQKTKQR